MKFVDIDKVKKDLDKDKPNGWTAEDFAKACEDAVFYTTIDDFMTEHGDEIEIMCFAPTPERTGAWECTDYDGGVYRCTACGEEWYLEAGTPEENNMHFCPHCGACMDAADDQGGGAEQTEHGRWIPREYDGYADGAPVWDMWECSECGHEHNGEEDTLTEFCPDCGAKMDAAADQGGGGENATD